jgi:hypothetical protein
MQLLATQRPVEVAQPQLARRAGALTAARFHGSFTRERA